MCQAALRAGLEKTVLNAVTAVMEERVTRLQETAPVAWDGQVTAVIKVRKNCENTYFVFNNKRESRGTV